MPIIVKGKLTNLSEKPKVKPEPKPTVNNNNDNEYLKKIEEAKNSFFNVTIEGEKPNWTKSDYLVDILSK
jgi:hypothetical protein